MRGPAAAVPAGGAMLMLAALLSSVTAAIEPQTLVPATARP